MTLAEGIGAGQAEPYVTFNFAVEIDRLWAGGCVQISGLDSQLAVDDYREGGVNSYAHRLPGPASHENLVLRHGLTTDRRLWEWFDRTTRGVIERKSGSIMLLDRDHATVRLSWDFRNALPVRWTGPSFDAANDEIGFESLELVHEGLTSGDGTR